MGDLVNLRQVRKRRARAERETTAAANRALHGRTKAERAIEALEETRRDSLLDGAKREE